MISLSAQLDTEIMHRVKVDISQENHCCVPVKLGVEEQAEESRERKREFNVLSICFAIGCLG